MILNLYCALRMRVSEGKCGWVIESRKRVVENWVLGYVV